MNDKKNYYLILYQYYSIKSDTVSHVGWKRRYRERAKQAYSAYRKYQKQRELNFVNLMKSIEEGRKYSTENFDLFGNLDDKSEHLRQSLLVVINSLFGSYEIFRLADYLYNIYVMDPDMAYDIFLFKEGDMLVNKTKDRIDILQKYIDKARQTPGEKIKDFYSLKKIKKYLA